MAKPALYRKYRSVSLDEIVGQDHIVDILRANLKVNKHAQSYLLTGPRGVGKTSIARILAYAVNNIPYGENHLDIIEIDAASNGSVDDARELRDRAIIAPAKLPYKVYIIDEVHMLSRQAFDALLKLIEEPPAHAIFIMATTEIDKVPATIKSRSEQYHFHLVPAPIITQHLKSICEKEGIEHEEEALYLLAELGRGSLRDAISHLDQVSSNKITRANIEKTFGLPPAQQIDHIISLILSGDTSGLVLTLKDLKNHGVNTASLTNSLLQKLEPLAPGDPKLFGLITDLLEVPKSSDPDLKLLAILGTFSSATPSTPPEVSKSSLKKETKTKTKTVPAEIPKEAPVTSKPTRQINWNDLITVIKETNQLFAANLSRATYEIDDDILTVFFATEVARKVADTAKYKKLLADTVKSGYGFALKVEVSPILTDKQSAPESKDTASATAKKYSALSAIMLGGV